MNEKNTAIGFAVTTEYLNCVLLEKRKDSQIEVKYLDYIPFYNKLDTQNFFNQKNRQIILESLISINEKYRFFDFNTCLTLDSRNSFIFKLPFDNRLSDEELKNQISWEFQTLMGEEKLEDYFINYNKISLDNSRIMSHALVIFLKKQFLNFIRNIFEDLNVTLNLIDLDFFSIEKSLMYNYSELENSNLVLFCVKGNSVEIGIISGGRIVSHRTLKFNFTTEIKEYIINEISEIEKNMNLTGIKAVFLFAPQFNSELINKIKSRFLIKIEWFNPFKKLIINHNALNSKLSLNPNLYASSAGIALRYLDKNICE